MNRNFEEGKHKKLYAKSKENQAIIKAFNIYGRVPEQWELLEEIERLNNQIKTLLKENGNKEKVIIKQNNIVNGMEKFIIYNLDYWNKEVSQRSSYIKETLTNTLDTLRKLKGKN